MNQTVSIAILWHFHQPIYSKPDDNTLLLPWVRLHCIKDYLDMLRHVQKFPEVHVTFNFTPSLLLQINDYKTGKSTDKQFLLFRKKAEDLTEEERINILRDFFLAHWERMIELNKRYFSLLLKRGKNIVEEELASIAQSFTANELRDLQIWSNLVWIDPLFRDEIKDLYEKGKNFCEEDKDRVIALEQKIIDAIFDEYKKALESGQIEITTSPLYHPILPLLINSNCAKESNPNLAIPFEFKHPEDAEYQIVEGINLFEKFFGQRPKGFWPSEGSVSQDLLPIISRHGIKWIATDEEILARSLKTSFRRDEYGVPNHPELLYKPWKCNDVNIVFRDHRLSDLIGFVYNSWNQTEAARDLTNKTLQLKNSLPTYESFIIPIILDGENAWESYENDGTQFLESLYDNFTKEGIKTTTISQFLKGCEIKNELSYLFPGSWIGANFNIWIAHHEDQKAWQIVESLREKLIEKKINDKAIWDRFYILEGSDWYWWFGGEHYSAVEEIFDELFRLNALWIYKKINEEPPPELFSTIKKPAVRLTVQPNDKMTPEIDGRITHFYEWCHAGHADVKRMGGTMHRFAGLFSEIYCGFDSENIYIRFDVENHNISEYEYKIKFYEPKDFEIVLGQTQNIVYKIDRIGEVAIPNSLLATDENKGRVQLIVSAQQKGVEIDRTPLLKFNVRLKDVKLYNWTV
jgi:alpha-amylase/alpha-mannosidase (GH57 family)